MDELGRTGHKIDPRGINHPRHYNNHKSGVEVIEVCRYMNFNCGSAFKYVIRRGEKLESGQTVSQSIAKDLDKAIWYLCDDAKHEAPYKELFRFQGQQALRKFKESEDNEHVRMFMLMLGTYCMVGGLAELGRAVEAVRLLKIENQKVLTNP